MNRDQELVKEPREWILERITESRCVCVGPCLLSYISVEHDGGQESYNLIYYDGQDEQGQQKGNIKGLYEFGALELPNPAYFRRGLYIDLSTNITSTTVQYLPLRD